jgi:uncharacterized membrane protein
MRWLLVVSLALNLMVVGLAAGSAWHGGGKLSGHHPSRLGKIGGPLTRALSKEDRNEIGREMRAAYRSRQDERSQQHSLMQSLIDDLRRSPFDREAIADHMAAQRDILQERVSLGQSILLDRLATMSPEDRAAYADRLKQALDHKRSR